MDQRGQIGKKLAQILGICLLSWQCQHFRPQPRAHARFSKDWSTLKKQVLADQITTDTFQRPGPYRWQAYRDFIIPVSPQNKVNTDLYISKHSGSSPLVIISHGNGYSKLFHRLQAERLASWGFHCLLLQLPNRHYWLHNGRTIDQLVRLIFSFPHLIHKSVDKYNIILAGHSFGGSAVTIAAAQAGPIKGLILLDPAVVHRTVKEAMSRVHVPVIVLGADPSVFTSRKRWQFFKYIPGPIAEVSITGATHTDAQYPSIYKDFWGFDIIGSQEIQEQFVSSLLVSAFSLSMTGRLDYAWHIFDLDLKRGLIKKARVRFAQPVSNATYGQTQQLSPAKSR